MKTANGSRVWLTSTRDPRRWWALIGVAGLLCALLIGATPAGASVDVGPGNPQPVGDLSAPQPPASAATGAVQPQASTLFTPLTPVRAADTRSGQAVQSGWQLLVTVGGYYGVPANAAAVVVNVTATQPAGGGHLRVYPCGQALPNASTLNYVAGRSVANSAMVALGTSGRVCVYTSTTTHILVDVTGYFPAGAAFTPRSPVRVADTRPGQPVALPATKVPVTSGGTLQVPIGGANGVPADAKAVVVNVTATQPAGGGHLRVFPCGQALPNASTLNYATGASVANSAVIALGTGGKVCIYSPTQTHVIVDVTGFFTAVSPYAPLTPVRAADTRAGTSLTGGWQLLVKVGGSFGVPANAAAVVLNVTATQPSGAGHLRVYPCGQPLPTASTLNYIAGASVANGAIVALGTEGKVCVYSPTTTHVLVDVAGYVPGDGAPASGASAVAPGGEHTCAIIAGGQVKCWGDNQHGQLGDGTTIDRTTPVAVVGLSGATAISAGSGHTCALVAGGQVKCWGANYSGQVGDGTTTNRSTPVAVSGLSGASALELGAFHSCAVVAGQAKCWGNNFDGELGDGSKTDRKTPVVVSGLTGVASLGAGTYHTCAVLTGGQAKCWGLNNKGQLGDGTTTTRLTPAAVSGLAGAVAVTADLLHTCALLTTGQAKCWGDNAYGQLGDGTVANRSTPVAVSGLNGAIRIGAGQNHVCALIAGGQGRCWGSNSVGQLGDGTTTGHRTPVPVSGLSGATALAVGSGQSCALLPSGQVKIWGWNSQGQLGDGTKINRLTPVTVVGIG